MKSTVDELRYLRSVVLQARVDELNDPQVGGICMSRQGGSPRMCTRVGGHAMPHEAWGSATLHAVWNDEEEEDEDGGELLLHTHYLPADSLITASACVIAGSMHSHELDGGQLGHDTGWAGEGVAEHFHPVNELLRSRKVTGVSIFRDDWEGA